MAEELRERLRTVDESAPSIQGAANAMMKHYDRSTTSIAVNEWRNALFSTTSSNQYIPLLYVANEVLQNSKRNRGNKFFYKTQALILPQFLCVIKLKCRLKAWANCKCVSRFICILTKMYISKAKSTQNEEYLFPIDSVHTCKFFC